MKRVPRVKLGEIVQIISGFAFESSMFGPEGDYPLVRIRDVSRGWSDTFYRGEFDPKFLVSDGDLLVSMDGEFRANYWQGGEALLNQRVCKIIPLNDRLSLSYLARYLPAELKKIEDRTPFVTVKHLSAKEIRNIDIDLPSISEQRRIAAILDKADAIRRKRQQALALADNFLRSAFLEHYQSTKPRHKSYLINGIALKQRNSFVNGPFGSNLVKSELQDEGVPVIYIRDIRDGAYNRVSTVFVTPQKADDLKSCNVKPGDVLIAKVGDPPGTAAVYPVGEPEGVVTQDVIRIRLDTNMALADYLVLFLNSPYGFQLLRPIIVEATRSRIGLGPLKSLSISLPSADEQRDFLSIVSATHRLLKRQGELSGDSETLFSSLSQRAFRGEL